MGMRQQQQQQQKFPYVTKVFPITSNFGPK